MKIKITFFLALFFSSFFVQAEDYLQDHTGNKSAYTFIDRLNNNLRVCGFNIRSASRIDAIQLKVCDSATNTSSFLPRRGGSSGYLNSFNLDRDEYVTAINGYIGKKDGDTRIFGLYIVTNKKTSPLYGSSTSSPFYYQAPTDGKHSIQGIVGWYKNELDSIGVFISDRTGI